MDKIICHVCKRLEETEDSEVRYELLHSVKTGEPSVFYRGISRFCPECGVRIVND